MGSLWNDLLHWLLTGGEAPAAEPNKLNPKLHELTMSVIKVMLIFNFFTLFFQIYLEEGSPIFILFDLGVSLLLTIVVAIARAMPLNSNNAAYGNANRLRDQIQEINEESTLAFTHSWLALIFFCALFLQVVKLVVAMLYGSASFLSFIELYSSLFFFLVTAAMPFWGIDHMPVEEQTVFGFGWKVYAIEACDIASMMIGFICLAGPNDDTTFGHHYVAAFFYFVFCSAALLVFGFMCANLLAIMFVRSVVDDTNSTPVMNMLVPDFGRTWFAFLTMVVVLLDVATDIPAFFMTIVLGSYKGNIGLTLNLLVNLVALLRVLYLAIYVNAAGARHAHEQQEGYIRVL